QFRVAVESRVGDDSQVVLDGRLQPLLLGGRCGTIVVAAAYRVGVAGALHEKIGFARIVVGGLGLRGLMGLGLGGEGVTIGGGWGGDCENRGRGQADHWQGGSVRPAIHWLRRATPSLSTVVRGNWGILIWGSFDFMRKIRID